jgi:hypothetical protein
LEEVKEGVKLTILSSHSPKDNVSLLVDLDVLDTISSPVFKQSNNLSASLSFRHRKAYEFCRWLDMEKFGKPVSLRCNLAHSPISTIYGPACMGVTLIINQRIRSTSIIIEVIMSYNTD